MQAQHLRQPDYLAMSPSCKLVARLSGDKRSTAPSPPAVTERALTAAALAEAAAAP